jgi:uncharacterized repeat protein (TIGR03803 family)
LIAALLVFGILSPIPALAQTETILYNFDYSTFSGEGCPFGTNNDNPHTGLLVYQGHLYGTTPEGGAGAKKVPYSNDGTVFRLSNPKTGGVWTEKTLHSFQPSPNQPGQGPTLDGLYPCAGLIQQDGTLYGTTLYGGPNGFGTIFALVPPGTGETDWTEYQIYNFMGESDGQYPFDRLIMDKSGAFYGVTRSSEDGFNRPTVFQLVCSYGTCTVNTLTFNTKGIIYNGDLLLDPSTGSIFGTTQNGGPNGTVGYGNVFQLAPIGGGKYMYYDLYDFTGGSDGDMPNGGLQGYTGDLFGTTQYGGFSSGTNGGGVVFELRELTPGSPYTFYLQHTFDGAFYDDGWQPAAGLYKDSTGNLWGTTEYGGWFRTIKIYSNNGTIFKLTSSRPGEWSYDAVWDFGGGPADGAYPQGRPTGDSKGNVYGTTNSGGTNGNGIVFEFTP